MPLIFWSQPPRRPAAPRVRVAILARVADEIVQVETIDRLTLWPTLRIRACLRLNAAVLRARSR